MSVNHDLSALADLCGILPSFYGLNGGERVTSPETQRALLAANGIDVSNDDAIRASLHALRHEVDDRWFPQEVIVESGVETPQEFGLGAEWDIRLDGSDEIIVSGEPRDYITIPPLASGIYTLTASASGRTEIITVLAAPRRLPDIATLTGRDTLWGTTIALYGVRSGRNTGLGDFEDLAQLGEVFAKQGAGFIGVNPLHTMGYCDRAAISPYSPSHRGFLNTTYIALDHVPGLDVAPDLTEFAQTCSADTVQYQAHKDAHSTALETLFKTFKTSGDNAAKSAFAKFRTDGGPDLANFAKFEALSELHGTDWRAWPDKPTSPKKTRIEFHMWLQWVAATQLAQAQGRAKAADMSLGLYLDLAVGSRRDGAESWCEQDAVATGVSIGAPPDHLSPEGQNWDLAAFAPRKLTALRYAPLRRILAQTMRHAGIIRIDHVLGLNRSFWIPDDGSAGAYIRQPFESLLAVIKIEAERHSCAVIGEDLGLVPDGFRDMMRDHGFYGYSVLQYEKDDHGAFRDPQHLPSQVLSCFATHDTPTVKGYEIGRDIDWWEKLSWVDEHAAQRMHDDRKGEVASLSDGADFRSDIHNRLASSSADLVAVQLDDILGEVEAQNLPGTIDQHPNWRRKYDVTLENLGGDARLIATSQMMNAAGRGATPRKVDT
ncbi:4-alpha-glucanotransferase [Octadecabacter sp. G9-8]|uniref:4-alpha-glucanotransferase n=1 Tax=Octadecabacter dasysiphoniae TaxID=2909341 RepID=A0ABS9CQM7_9RHOB|nr:4-alpha-glucanotransferase [Octadecabacter dasysiphoniae]MCF2869532.1 4-alpha-glucanotransferase [Octadecabacter dasysiphoniae]